MVLSTADIVAMQVCQFQKDPDELDMLQAFNILHKVFGRRRLLLALQFLSSQQTSGGRSFCYAMFAKVLNRCLIVAQIVSSFMGLRIGEASNPGPRLRRRGPRSSASMAARWGGGEAPVEETPGILEGQHTCSEQHLSMLHINLHGYLSHNAKVTSMLRGMVDKPFSVTMNESS